MRKKQCIRIREFAARKWRVGIKPAKDRSGCSVARLWVCADGGPEPAGGPGSATGPLRQFRLVVDWPDGAARMPVVDLAAAGRNEVQP